MHGNPGDYPVVAYQYIEGYIPQAYNLEGLRLEEGKDNSFTFVYRPVPVEEGTVIIYDEVIINLGPTQGTFPTPIVNPGNEGEPEVIIDINDNETPAVNPGGDGTNPTPGGDGTNPTPGGDGTNPTPGENIDDNDTPLTPGNRNSWLIYAAGGVAGVGLIAFLLTRKKDDEEEEENK